MRRIATIQQDLLKSQIFTTLSVVFMRTMGSIKCISMPCQFFFNVCSATQCDGSIHTCVKLTACALCLLFWHNCPLAEKWSHCTLRTTGRDAVKIPSVWMWKDMCFNELRASFLMETLWVFVILFYFICSGIAHNTLFLVVEVFCFLRALANM